MQRFVAVLFALALAIPAVAQDVSVHTGLQSITEKFLYPDSHGVEESGFRHQSAPTIGAVLSTKHIRLAVEYGRLKNSEYFYGPSCCVPGSFDEPWKGFVLDVDASIRERLVGPLSVGMGLNVTRLDKSQEHRFPDGTTLTEFTTDFVAPYICADVGFGHRRLSFSVHGRYSPVIRQDEEYRFTSPGEPVWKRDYENGAAGYSATATLGVRLNSKMTAQASASYRRHLVKGYEDLWPIEGADKETVFKQVTVGLKVKL